MIQSMAPVAGSATTGLGGGMQQIGRRLRASILGIRSAEADFKSRGFFAGDPFTRSHLEAAGRAFLLGYNASLAAARVDDLRSRLQETGSHLRGFAYEGAAMGLTLVDLLSLGGRYRWRQLLDGPGDHYFYLIFVGAGWAWARIPLIRVLRARRALDPLYGWLAVDGFGFHNGYFTSGRNMVPPRHRLNGYELRAFDQGFGRSLWFVHCGDANRIGNAIARFTFDRRADLWSGVGLAAAYAGPLETDAAATLRAWSEPHHAHLALGACFGAAARARSGHVPRATDVACRALTGLDTMRAAALAVQVLPRGTEAQSDSAYEEWRTRIRLRLMGNARVELPA